MTERNYEATGGGAGSGRACWRMTWNLPNSKPRLS